jgi:hypothetical protein
MQKNIIDKFFFYDSYNIRKRLKFLIEVTQDDEGAFSFGAKLSNVLNQNGLYDNDKIIDKVKFFLNNIPIVKECVDEVTIFYVPIVLIFPKKKRKTLLYVLNPFQNSFFSFFFRLNIFDYYCYMQYKLRDYSFLTIFNMYSIKNFLYFIFIRRNVLRSKIVFRKNFFFLSKKKKITL